MRIDKFIWCVRLAKSRNIAADYCEHDKVRIESIPVKPSKEVKPGALFELKQNPIWRKFQVLELPKSRVAAKLVSTYVVELTEKSALDELDMLRQMNSQSKAMGIVGRPTKKDRRDLDRYTDG